MFFCVNKLSDLLSSVLQYALIFNRPDMSFRLYIVGLYKGSFCLHFRCFILERHGLPSKGSCMLFKHASSIKGMGGNSKLKKRNILLLMVLFVASLLLLFFSCINLKLFQGRKNSELPASHEIVTEKAEQVLPDIPEPVYEKKSIIVSSGDTLIELLVKEGLDRTTANTVITTLKKVFNPRQLQKGQSVRKTLMVTPIDGARLSSGYGMRRHPVLGYSRMHKGLDFAARIGTPIMAAGDGVIDYIGRKGGYGKYIRIRHANEYKTGYGHMSRYAKGIRKGARVKQGQIIGYVGSTGVSTGPHLHYEVFLRNKSINPASIKTPPGRSLKGDELKKFFQTKNDVERLYASLIKESKIARLD